ncbi:tripartite tricarboxylate transporter substrate binding protein [Pusillimonas sp. TS35]|uniref:tripartite tricarboxylate transporter substrate binding protein n=1 Tax=Paracandidimonas lactea TaxID=2895524 RepID=UPI00136D9409|nr:tripartite tricarboxylate transporter substrate binding protein [Paracandidimonas lactea]MYN13492.1 tripartite tricarboxylate transporter substrate binding protein [Pusillimonas sp. TS35]
MSIHAAKLLGIIALAAAVAPAAVLAESAGAYPSQPITLIVPYAPGGTTDLVGRALADSLSRQLKQSVVVENKPGAAGSMGVLDMMTSKPDGYRLTMAPVGIFRQPYLQKTRYDPIKDLTYIASILSYDFAVTVKSDSPFKSMKDLVEYARAHPGEITYSTPGRYTGNQVVLASLGKKEGVQFSHIPYKGDSDATSALLGGHTKVGVITNSVLSYLRAGTVRVLATADAARNPAFGDVPTLKEAGYDVEVPSPLGVAGPAGLPDEIVEKLDKAIKAALQDTDVKRVLDNLGVRTYYMDHTAYAAFAKTTFKNEKDIINSLGLQD